MRRLAAALLLLGCDAAEEGRGPGVYQPGFTTSASAGTSEGETTASATAGEASTSSTSSTPPATTTTTGGETSGSTSSGGDTWDTTGVPTTTTTGDATTSTGTTGDVTGPDTTTGGEPPCPCLPGIQAGQNVCAVEPTPECPATLPGGLCDPDGDGAFDDADWIAGYKAYLAACG